MKCPNCGGNLSLEDNYCPYCGKPNALARRHVSDMEQFKQDYEKTKEEVRESHLSAGFFKGLIARVILLSVLVVGIIISLTMLRDVYSIRYKMEIKDSTRHAAEYMDQLEDYLGDEDYITAYQFMKIHEMDFIHVYQKYSAVRYVLFEYDDVCDTIMQIVFPRKYGTYDDLPKQLSDSLREFYKSGKRRGTYLGEDMVAYQQFTRQHYEKMKDRINELLVTYLDLSKEQAESLEEKSDANRYLIIEEAVNEKIKRED